MHVGVLEPRVEHEPAVGDHQRPKVQRRVFVYIYIYIYIHIYIYIYG